MKGLKRCRELAGYSRSQFAGTMGVDISTVTKWETGASYPPAAKLPTIALLLHCSIDELYRDLSA